MEFDVIDPKDHGFEDWICKVETFLEQFPEYDKREGELYFVRDDIAEPWREESIVYEVDGEDGGVIEVRSEDQQIYIFVEEFAGRNLKETKDISSFQVHSPGSVYGFTQQSASQSRFHEGPIENSYFIYPGGKLEHSPKAVPAEKLFHMGVFLQAFQ